MLVDILSNLMTNCFRNLGKNPGFLGDLKALSKAIFFYVGILFHPSHVSTAMFYVCSFFIPLCSCSYGSVRRCSMFWYFIQYISTLIGAMFYVCWYFIPLCSREYDQDGGVLFFDILFSLSTLLRLVQPCSIYADILFRFAHVSTISTPSAAMFFVCWYFIWF